MNSKLLAAAFSLITLSACGQTPDHIDDPLHPLGEMPEPDIRLFREQEPIPADSVVPVEADYFRPPLDIPIGLGGTFGELRPNHFHAGIDIRTNAQEGLTVRSCADGFVSRIKVSAYGYGNALYIDHPNGYTTVYAHLNQFEEPVASYVKSKQYEAESFEVDIYPDDTTFPVTKGMKIALSGNSGRSTTPHLHFEIRETKSEWPVNPLLLTNWVEDNVPPVITRWWWYYSPSTPWPGAGDKRTVMVSGKAANRLYSKFDTVKINASEIVLGVHAYDLHNGKSGDNDINSLELWLDGVQIFGWTLRKFSFDQTRSINAHIDYRIKHQGGEMIHRLYRAPRDPMPCYTSDGNGVIRLSTELQEVLIKAQDAAGNLTELRFWLIGVDNPLRFDDPQDTISASRIDTVIASPTTFVFMPNSFFYPVSRKVVISEHGCLLPVQREFQVINLASSIPASLQDKVLLMRHDVHGNSRTALSSEWDNGFIKATSTQLGSFEIAFDTTAPLITLTSSGTSSIKFTITDNLSGIEDYDAYIDDQWVLPVYDAKNNRITHTFEKSLPAGSHEFKLVVTDAVGNVAEKVAKVVR